MTSSPSFVDGIKKDYYDNSLLDRAIGNSAGTTLDEVSGQSGMQGPTQGTGITGAVTRNFDLGMATNPVTGNEQDSGADMGNNKFSTIFSGVNNYMTNADIQDQLMAAEQQAAAQYAPYQELGLGALTQGTNALQQGFNYDDYANSDAYKFQLEQGQKQLQNQLAASGLGQSGAALKAAQQYGTGMASQNYGDEYNRWLQQQNALTGIGNVGYNAMGNVANSLTNLGGIGALTKQAQSENINKTLAQLLSGKGYF
jgi:hypothetical protein